ncbi:hypothetical protein C8R43DRAFT_1139033 [Mycena crocata]|nr:hypothetical protein C8R43DRAFT_1139033 [Mycena crocata]
MIRVGRDTQAGIKPTISPLGPQKVTRHTMTFGITPEPPRIVPITYKSGVPYEANRYRVKIRTEEELKQHIEQLQAYMKTCPVSTHDNVGFLVDELSGFDISLLSYSAMLPPIALRWVQARLEVESITKQVRVYLSTTR